MLRSDGGLARSPCPLQIWRALRGLTIFPRPPDQGWSEKDQVIAKAHDDDHLNGQRTRHKNVGRPEQADESNPLQFKWDDEQEKNLHVGDSSATARNKERLRNMLLPEALKISAEATRKTCPGNSRRSAGMFPKRPQAARLSTKQP